MRVLVSSIFAAALLATVPVARPAFAHGGQYRGPAGEVPPDSRQPEDPPPPDTGTGTPTPPDTGTGTPTPPDTGTGTPTPPDPGPSPEPPAGPGGPVPGPGGGSGPGTRTKGPSKKAASFESWRFWWDYNKDEILARRRALRGGAARTAGGSLGTSFGGVAGGQEDQGVTAREVEERVVPVLVRYAQDAKVNFDIQSAAVFGLARIGRRERVPLMMQLARNEGPVQVHPVVEESAALALGVLQERSAVVRKFLGDLAGDVSAKKRTRCFAAFSLGLLGGPGGDAGSLAVLESMASDPAESGRELSCSALVAMGHLGDPAAIPFLVRCLKEERAGERRLDDLQLACAASALGKIGRPGVAAPLCREVVDALRDQLRLKNRLTRYSAVIALGQVAPAGDGPLQAECVDALCGIVASENRGGIDVQTVDFALISLGRIAGAAPGAEGRPGCPADVRGKAVARLVAAFEGKSATRSFAALGLGLAAMDLDERARRPLAKLLGESLARASGDVEQRGAPCIALGLLRDIEAEGELESLLRNRAVDKRLRGTAALGLGLIGDPGAADAVRGVLKEKEDRELRIDAAVAAGLLGDGKAVDTLVEVLVDPKPSQFVIGSAAIALGRIGDHRALDPLLKVLGGEAYPDLTRALACVALGQIGDRSGVPVLSRMSKDVNYRAYFDAIGEVLTIF